MLNFGKIINNFRRRDLGLDQQEKEQEEIKKIKERIDSLEIVFNTKLKENQNIVQPETIIKCHNDHRIAMSIAPLSMKVDSIEFDNKDVVNKSYPKFWEDFNSVIN